MAEKDDLAQIVNGCKSGDSDSFSKLLSLYCNRLYGFFFRLSGNNSISDDLLSELFVKLVEKIKDYRGGNFEVWLFTIASNLFNDHLRTKMRDKQMLGTRLDYFELDNIHDNSETTDSEVFDKLQQNLDRLDRDTRELIMLRFYGQLSFKELAQMRSEPIGTILSKVHRGLKTIRELME
jgi:RNA polymerase sigma-70 factor (ECF subfamily)